MAKLLQVAQLGQPLLRETSLPVKDIANVKIQTLIDEMLATVVDVAGLGLAAPQVYELSRIFIIASHPNPRYPDAPYMEPVAVINPKIIKHSRQQYDDWEGCLSIPGLRGLVPRWKWVEVSYQDRTGQQFKRKFIGLVGRIFQHEYDHLEGILFVDRVRSSKDLMTDKEYLRMIAAKQTKEHKGNDLKPFPRHNPNREGWFSLLQSKCKSSQKLLKSTAMGVLVIKLFRAGIAGKKGGLVRPPDLATE